MVEEQLEAVELLIDQAGRFLASEATPKRLKELLEQPGSFDHALWHKVTALGWPALVIPEAHGGFGLSWTGLARLSSVTGRNTVSLPLVAGAITSMALAKAGVLDDVIAGLTDGSMIATLSLCSSGESGLARSPGVAMSGGKLSGVAAPAAFAAIADVALIAVFADGEAALALVNLDQPTVARAQTPSIDNARASASLAFDGATGVIVGRGWDELLHHAAIAATLIAFEQVAGAQHCLDLAVTFARERKVFGQPIGRFQAIKHRCADIYCEIEIARGCAIDALLALERDDPGFVAGAAAARIGATAAYDFAARETIQMHGGIGVMWEAEPQHHYRRARALGLELGGSPFWRDLLVNERNAIPELQL